MPPPVAEAVLATVREAFDNVERHNGARTVSPAVTAGARGLRLTVSDDGVGFPLETEGRGPRAMKAGMAKISGTLRINSVLGAGTTVSAVAPLDWSPLDHPGHYYAWNNARWDGQDARWAPWASARGSSAPTGGR
ncbi:sensor histidine kinase [Nonomuraea sp. CA-141351]|uniref:sensor histidine kinase n=1 Tax=Nonomuraea sp. CA-141351 TaxID=3239996 RepID=UPI003D89B9AB